jgi:hypothetical protein
MQLIHANLEELRYWKEVGYTEKDLDNFYSETLAVHKAIKYIWNGSGRLTFTSKGDLKDNYTNNLFTFLKKVVVQDKIKPFSIVASAHDTTWADNNRKIPYFCYDKPKDDRLAILLPDPHYLESDGYISHLSSIFHMAKIIPWEARIPGIYWRGRTTGWPNLTKEEWQDNQRIKLCLFGKQVEDLRALNFQIAEICQCEDEEVIAKIKATGIVTGEVEFTDFCLYKYQLDINGNSCAWGLFWKLFIGPIFKVEGDNIQWFYRFLKPWEHYIPVKKDLSDLLELLEWARSNDDECKKIHQNAVNLVLDNNYKNLVSSAGILCSLIEEYKRE